MEGCTNERTYTQRDRRTHKRIYIWRNLPTEGHTYGRTYMKGYKNKKTYSQNDIYAPGDVNTEKRTYRRDIHTKWYTVQYNGTYK